ncbi:Rv2578c family radical SAM protein [Kibdelosporangium philippinense]|uniref:Rv2578c family radical SAM protein n=2 Tax=Kibdelosporangium philippinense TaxID=211113 RepID=A0ABS8ZS36_9PSEU|nr:Rv2578c family radical SAM protein [Kibdelosporangium philippinense]MCE7010544.1 Rv2578c family radical SAM protein [Kibdelosporangium philippinense]
MRWDAQRADRGQLALPGLVRTVRTPEFADITFHEVHAKSVLNRVPASSSMPFQWTINPYRGCSHACTYCLAGDTEILMRDGTTRPLADVNVGDEIYGTGRLGNHRYRVPTRVLAHWSTVKPAFRVTLEDGTTLVASREHRLLTEQGWQQVAEGITGQPFLVNGIRLVTDVDGVVEPRLTVVNIEPLDESVVMYDVTTGTGDFIANQVVSHNCFARNTHTYLEFDAGRDFDTQIVVKVNAPEVVAKQVRSPKWQREHVAMGTNTDPYQRAEGRYKLMPRIIEALADSGTPFSILTKGTVMVRDIPLLVEASKQVSVGIGVSLALVDRELQQRLEPGTPSPQARLDMIKRVTDAGLPCGVMVAPVIPRMTDSREQLEAALSQIAEAGATGASMIPLHLRPGTREWFAEWLARERPDLLDDYRDIYARGSYANRAYRDWLGARVKPLVRKYGLEGRSFPSGSMPQAAPKSPPVAAEQLELMLQQNVDSFNSEL